MVVDLAMTVSGDWIAIECNDAMEGGYAGVSPLGLWRSILGRSPVPLATGDWSVASN